MQRSLMRGFLGGLALCLLLLPSAAQAWWNDDWPLRKPLTIDTGPAGANIADPIGTLPLLVRLHTGNFNFEAANDDGSDLRFISSDDLTPLNHHVEQWDALLGEAFVWVQVPQLAPGSSVDFWMYYGNPLALPSGSGGAAFDGDTVLAYHFAERNRPVRDWSVWNNAALDAGAPGDGALIGQGLRLDGQTTVALPASPSLNWSDTSEVTWSAWIRPEQLQSDAVVFSRQEGQNAFVIGVNEGLPFVEVQDPTGLRRAFARSPMNLGGWHHLAVTAAAGEITLYLDGTPTATLGASLPGFSGSALIGGSAPVPVAAPALAEGALPGIEPVTDPEAAATPEGEAVQEAPAAPAGEEGAEVPDGVVAELGQEAQPGLAGAPQPALARPGFVGEMDELRIANTLRPAGYILASAISQGPESATLLTLGLDEEEARWFSGYIAVIMGSLTIDGWSIIAVLMVIAVISWVVMADKAIYLRRLERANRRFLAHFKQLPDDFTALDRGSAEDIEPDDRLPKEDQEMIRSSSLYRIYHIAAEEVRKRRARGRTQALTAESLTAIRASLNAGQVRESQKMNRLLVILTIAISGGPFFGLLGTVVGVMITFAAIAAAGDVNVNAIAPGISAALMTTVVGLGVAIPALFGYNWLLTRIRNSTATMNVFVDELVTRLAEHQSDDTQSPARFPVSMPAE